MEVFLPGLPLFALGDIEDREALQEGNAARVIIVRGIVRFLAVLFGKAG